MRKFTFIGLFLAAIGTWAAPALAAPDRIGLYSGENSYFQLLAGNTESAQDTRFQLGYSHSSFTQMFPIAGNFDGAGGDSVGTFDYRSSQFFLKYSNGAGGQVDTTFTFGNSAYTHPLIPVAGSWTGNGRDTIGLFDPQTATFQLKNSNAAGAADTTFQFGDTSAYPVAGDWAKSGHAGVGTYNLTTGLFKLKTMNAAGAPDFSFVFNPSGSTTAIPVIGDWDGDGSDTAGVYDSATYRLYLRNANSAGPADATVQLSAVNWRWVPLAGQWRPASGPPESSGFAWLTASPQSEGFDPVKLDAAFAKAETVAPMRSLLVIRRGNLVKEAYFHGARPELANNIHSVSKSVVSALVGIAQSEGLLGSMDTLISTLMPPAYFSGADPRLSQVTLAHLMTMSVGMNVNEDTSLITMIQSNDFFAQVLSNPFSTNPGTLFNYYTGYTHLMSYILTTVIGMPLDQYAKVKIFDKLGVKIMGWGHDPMGYMQAGSEVWMKPRDLARFGYLFLQRGVVNGQQIVPPEWVDRSTSNMIPTDDGRTYGYWWWRPLGAGTGSSNVFEAIGHGGQYILVIPAADLLIVATARGDTNGAELDQAYTDIAGVIAQVALSAGVVGSVTTVPEAFDSVRVYPNPWRADRDAGRPVTLDGFKTLTHTKLFTVAGHWVKDLPDSSSGTTWDLTTQSGNKAASGTYLYLLTTDDGQKKTGQIAVIK